MTNPDFKLIAATLAPLLVWPFVPPWEATELNEGGAAGVALFLLIPIVEEVVFRGFLQGWLLQKVWFGQTTFGLSRANHFTSLAFAAAHLWQHPLWLFPGYFAVSLLLGFFRERYNGVLVPILLHSYYNLGLWLFAD